MNLFLQDVECKYESLLTYTANMAYDFLQCMYESVAKYPHLPGGEYTLCLYWLSIYRYTIYMEKIYLYLHTKAIHDHCVPPSYQRGY